MEGAGNVSGAIATALLGLSAAVGDLNRLLTAKGHGVPMETGGKLVEDIEAATALILGVNQIIQPLPDQVNVTTVEAWELGSKGSHPKSQDSQSFDSRQKGH
ncbi:hypothetical protein Pelo_1631 [Pelomyxa schiedti]|nr:hypothetical protein Pelo_1631 [Pelomyxa schiedti]